MNRFYEIKAVDGGFMYHEFICGYGYAGNDLDDVYIKFPTRSEAEKYAKAHCAKDAYGY
jgi:hypothetical protein